ncbi:AraC-like DNA-binding protein [Sphingomonas naasensis]|uniref:Helix-turn-helix domain-containing protein n=1 Tax=Sphingomonas naasensis TaxID=1344951 RepID=A0A4S1WWR6_9SPHN|nr:helix-turn-helix domain-containing protein [Sphingomonas naasensis]NIJ18798.1 AraC-like DNA-binding protein [Sphingomonas naasensis]TGX46026.1 helix-turn-helix domain-containing protein [Sphingomonas naasensis]
MGVRRGIEPVRYSTASIPPAERHETWSSRGFPSIAGLFDSTPIGPFSTSAENIALDGIIVSYSHGTARQLQRTAERIASDGIDILGVGVMLEGEMRGTARSREFALRDGEILLFDLTQPVTMTMSIARSIQLAIPRALAESQLGAVAALHGVVIGRDEASLLHAHLVKLSESLQLIAAEDAPRLARTLLDLLVVAVHAATGAEDGTPPPPRGAAARAREEVRANLESPSLSVANLCRRLKVSRSTLHRLFEKEGGVQTYIRNTRLDAARQALLDPGNEERIGGIADRLGFSDAAHFSRLFRARFGQTPSQCRAQRGPGG